MAERRSMLAVLALAALSTCVSSLDLPAVSDPRSEALRMMIAPNPSLDASISPSCAPVLHPRSSLPGTSVPKHRTLSAPPAADTPSHAANALQRASRESFALQTNSSAPVQAVPPERAGPHDTGGDHPPTKWPTLPPPQVDDAVYRIQASALSGRSREAPGQDVGSGSRPGSSNECPAVDVQLHNLLIVPCLGTPEECAEVQYSTYPDTPEGVQSLMDDRSRCLDRVVTCRDCERCVLEAHSQIPDLTLPVLKHKCHAACAQYGYRVEFFGELRPRQARPRPDLCALPHAPRPPALHAARSRPAVAPVR